MGTKQTPKKFKKVVLLGSGGLSIGQAGEFDYSGTQAAKAIREEGIELVIINPNIATVQTNPAEGTHVYLYPVEPLWVERVIEEEKPDAIIAGFGGQTALNCVMKLDEMGILKKHGVQNLGTPVDTLRTTEDRKLFAEAMAKIGMPIPPSQAISSMDEALKAAKKIGYPMILRAAYALGGLGSGFATNETELRALVDNALANSPQALLERSLKGWKEVEYEVMRDSAGNAITICNMENLDPLGIHTGDSIVVAPSQTLSNDEYQLLRDAALKIVHSLGVVGECNVQFALDPNSLQFYVIEVNARLSRSSALASKASGYPIAFVAAKAVLGYTLLELKNPVTGITTAFYEPALDYVTVKIPRWDMAKFRGANRRLGSAMKSVGEIMAIGRNMNEAIQKAVRMVTEKSEGLSAPFYLTDSAELPTYIKEALKNPTDQRFFALAEAFRQGMSVSEVNALTSVDCWFLSRIQELIALEKEIQTELSKLEYDYTQVPGQLWSRWKSQGFGDEQIASLALRQRTGQENAKKTSPPRSDVQSESLKVRQSRSKKGVIPIVKKIDTTAAEYPSPSNYLYMSYSGNHHDPLPEEKKKKKTAIVLGGGAYRVGSSVEFDWCAVSCSGELKRAGWRSVIINCNPETVSTDFNSSDRLFFEELTLERILDIAEYESAEGVIVSMGGQLPNCLALGLAQAGLKLMGHSPETIDLAEDRSKFSTLLDKTQTDQPRWTSARSRADIQSFIKQVGFPVLVRPSYVLSGAAMNVAWDDESLNRFLATAEEASADHPIVISEFIESAKEIEVDGVAQDGSILAAIVSEHVENAGIHSGDATTVIPPHTLETELIHKLEKKTELIARELKLNGPFNIQFLARGDQVKVIECNARASRSFPFVSKVTGFNLARLATEVMMNQLNEAALKKVFTTPWMHALLTRYTGVKAPMFSFNRLEGVDPVVGVEMLSTGEVGCMAKSYEEALLLAMQSTGVRTPKKGVLVSAGPKAQKEKFLANVSILEEMEVPLFATEGTVAFLKEHGIKAQKLAWPGEGEKDVLKAIQAGWVDFVINIPKNLETEELLHSAEIRKSAVRHGCSLLTDMEKTTAFLTALSNHQKLLKTHKLVALPQYRS